MTPEDTTFAESAVKALFTNSGLEAPSNLHTIAIDCFNRALEVCESTDKVTDLDIQMEFRRIIEDTWNRK